MMTSDVMKGRMIDRIGSTIGRIGSKSPQLVLLASGGETAGSRCAIASSASKTSFLPLRLPLRT